MELDDRNLEQLLQSAISAARRAAAHIREETGNRREVLKKEGGSSHASQVVTGVDFESQRLILETLAGSITEFELGLLTEESQDDSSRHACDYFWCIDPLDGTLPFIEGVAGYSVSIALVSRAGVPQIGVILDPVEDSLVHAVRGGGAFRDGRAIDLGTARGAPLTLVMDRSFAQQENYELVLERVREITARRFGWGEDHQSGRSCDERLLGDRERAGGVLQISAVEAGWRIAVGLRCQRLHFR